MSEIPWEKLRKDNSNIRKFDDRLWRELRKERFKPAKPDVYTNEMAAEAIVNQNTPNSNFHVDVENFMTRYLSPQEAAVFKLFVFCGKIRQAEIGEILGIAQPTVAVILARVLGLFREHYYPEITFTSEVDSGE